jgi:NADH dehydrogenase
MEIVIIGGGFAGLNLAKNCWIKGINVTLVDKIIIIFPPLIYQVATAFLEPSSTVSFRKFFAVNLQFRLGDLQKSFLKKTKSFYITENCITTNWFCNWC